MKHVPRTAAKTLRTKRTFSISFVTCEIAALALIPLFRGIESRVSERDYQLVVTSRRPKHRTQGPTAILNQHSVDGILVFANALSDEELTYLSKIGLPLICVCYSSPEEIDVPSIIFDNKNGTAQLINHLITVHHRRRIGFLRGPNNSADSKEREEAYLKVLRAFVIPLDEALVDCGGFDTKIAQTTIEKWIDHDVDFDAVFAGDDESAVGVLKALSSAGIKVPEDVSVVGFDDDYTAHYLQVPLSTVRVPKQKLGEVAAEHVLELIEDGKFHSVTLPTEVVYRKSCGCNV